MPMVWWVKTDDEGTIMAYQRSTVLDSPMPPGYTALVPDEEERKLLQFEGEACRRVNGKIVRKPVVKFVTDTYQIDADGEDEAHVTFEGVPSEYTEIEVGVSGESATVDPNDVLIVTSSVPGNVLVHMLEKHLHAKPIKIRAKKVAPNG